MLNKKLNKIKKGFTLTELIIVIVIIGILAAVLIPSISGYVKKAKISKGIQEATEMNTILAAEAVYQDKEYFEPYEVKQIVKEADFTLESKLEDYRFWYDASVNQIKYLSMDEAFSKGSSDGKKVANQKNSFAQDCIEALSSNHPEYRYVDSYDDELTDAVETIRNLISTSLEACNISKSEDLLTGGIKLTELSNVINKMDELVRNAASSVGNAKIKGISQEAQRTLGIFVNTFDTVNSVYIDNNIMYNRAYFTTGAELTSLDESSTNITINDGIDSEKKICSLTVAHMIFDQGVSRIPECRYADDQVEYELTLTTAIIVPDTVTYIASGSFTNIEVSLGIVVYDLTIMAEDAFSDAAKETLTTQRTNSKFVTLYLGTDFTISYESAEARLDEASKGKAGYVYYLPNGDDPKEVKLETIIYQDNELVYSSAKKDDRGLISKYLIPTITLNSNKIPFGKIRKFILRRSLVNNICIYSGILIDEDLNAYKIESFGYITDIDWEIEQDFYHDEAGVKVPGATSAVVRVYLPSYVYEFSNFKGCSMEITLQPQYINTKIVAGITGEVEVFDGIELSDEKITFYIEDGVFDPKQNMYIYEQRIDDLSKYPLHIEGIQGDDNGNVYCNRLGIYQISIYSYSGDEYNEDGSPKDVEKMNYLFMRYYNNAENNE